MIIAAAVALGVMVFFAGNLGNLFLTRKELIVQFPQGMSGEINTGADVRFAGAKIGVVSQIDVQDDRVELRIRVDDAVAIKTNSIATVKSTGLLGGDKYLNISAGSPPAPVVKPGDILIGEEEMAVEDLIQTVSQIARNTQRITAAVDRLLSGEDGQPGEVLVTLEKTKHLLDEGNKTIAGLNRVIDGNTQNIQTMVTRLSGITGQVGDLIKTNRDAIDTTMANIHAMTAQLPEILTEVRTTLVKVQEISDRIRQGDGTAGRLISDDELHLRLQRLIDNTDQLIEQIKTRGIRVRIF